MSPIFKVGQKVYLRAEKNEEVEILKILPNKPKTPIVYVIKHVDGEEYHYEEKSLAFNSEIFFEDYFRIGDVVYFHQGKKPITKLKIYKIEKSSNEKDILYYCKDDKETIYSLHYNQLSFFDYKL